jgi:4-amino-4-deoxychorismate lyase
MTDPLPDFSLIETMRWEPGAGIARLDLHRARFGNSARKLGFAGHHAAWNALLARAALLSETSRLRLELFADGRFEIAAVAFALQPGDTIWTVRITETVRLYSTRPLLRHKTSLRQAYEAARASFTKAEADEVLLLNEKGEVCEGTITSLFVDRGDGRLITPPLSSGCLAGILRTSLLCRKKARVERIMPDDLAAHRFYVGNSLRGLIRARLLK